MEGLFKLSQHSIPCYDNDQVKKIIALSVNKNEIKCGFLLGIAIITALENCFSL